MNLEILTVCEFAVAYSHRLCIIGVDPIFYAKAMPFIPNKFYLVYRIRFDLSEGGTHSIKLSMIDNDGEVIAVFFNGPVTFEIENDSPVFTGTAIISVNGVSIPKFGVYSVELNVDGEGLASQPLCFLPAPQPA